MAYSSDKKPIKGDKMDASEIEAACRRALDNSMGGPGSEVS